MAACPPVQDCRPFDLYGCLLLRGRIVRFPFQRAGDLEIIDSFAEPYVRLVAVPALPFGFCGAGWERGVSRVPILLLGPSDGLTGLLSLCFLIVVE